MVLSDLNSIQISQRCQCTLQIMNHLKNCLFHNGQILTPAKSFRYMRTTLHRTIFPESGCDHRSAASYHFVLRRVECGRHRTHPFLYDLQYKYDMIEQVLHTSSPILSFLQQWITTRKSSY